MLTKQLKKIHFLVLLLLLSILFAGCSKPQSFPKDTLAYASYSNGDYHLYFIDPKSLESLKRVKLGEGYGFKLFKDKKGQFWAPIDFRSDSTTQEELVAIYDPKTDKTHQINVGLLPTEVVFKNNTAYIVCAERGKDPTIYKVDENFNVEKWLTVTDGGLISSVQFDGDNIYWNSVLAADTDNPKPYLIKVNLNNKEWKREPLAKEFKGISNLLYYHHKLYMGMNDEEGTLVEFDKDTLKKVKALSYKEDMVGDLLVISNEKIAVTDFSQKLLEGSRISIVNTTTGETINRFDTKYPIEKLSYIHNRFYAVDNLNNKLSIYEKNGKLVKIKDIPTMVTNIMEIN